MLGRPVAALALGILAASAHAEEEPLPFHMPVPDGWRTETIPFPLEFAPDLPYTGLEEIRFAPGMLDEGSDEFWTYSFVWWVPKDSPTAVGELAGHLSTYFRGLAEAVAESREFEVGSAAEGDGDSFRGRAETLDVFVTRDPRSS